MAIFGAELAAKECRTTPINTHTRWATDKNIARMHLTWSNKMPYRQSGTEQSKPNTKKRVQYSSGWRKTNKARPINMDRHCVVKQKLKWRAKMKERLWAGERERSCKRGRARVSSERSIDISGRFHAFALSAKSWNMLLISTFLAETIFFLFLSLSLVIYFWFVWLSSSSSSICAK